MTSGNLASERSALLSAARSSAELGEPLCRAYLAVFFRSSRPFAVAGAPTVATYCTGLLADGSLEISGPWILPCRSTARSIALQEISRRGVEKIGFEVAAAGYLNSSPVGTLPASSPSIAATRSIARCERRVLDLQQLVDRALRRRASFSDEAAAAAFIATSLAQGQRGLDPKPAASRRSGQPP